MGGAIPPRESSDLQAAGTEEDGAARQLQARALSERIRDAITAPGYSAPVSPAIAIQLIQLAGDPSVPVPRVRVLVQSEPLIAAQLLGIAQSAHYSRGVAITSLDDAITRLGMRTISDLFLQATLSAKVFRADGYDEPMKRVRVHSVVSAHVARLICRRTGQPDDYAFLCGLLHDVGFAAAIGVVGSTIPQSERPSYEEMEPALLLVHEEASGVIAKAWQLPEDIARVLAHHHDFRINGDIDPMAACICLADGIADRVGANAGPEVGAEQVDAAAAALGLRSQDVEGFVFAGENFVSIA